MRIPLLLCAPGGLDASIDKWRTGGAWRGLDAIGALSAKHKVIAYDRRESGRSGGRVERLSWSAYTEQAKALLDHLHVSSAYVAGGCMGARHAFGYVEFPSSDGS